MNILLAEDVHLEWREPPCKRKGNKALQQTTQSGHVVNNSTSSVLTPHNSSLRMQLVEPSEGSMVSYAPQQRSRRESCDQDRDDHSIKRLYWRASWHTLRHLISQCTLGSSSAEPGYMCQGHLRGNARLAPPQANLAPLQTQRTLQADSKRTR